MRELETLNKIATTAEPEKERAELRSAGQPGAVVPTWAERRPAARRKTRHGWLSRLRSYFILDPLVWAYTLVLGTFSLISSLFDRNGRTQHNFARLWSWLVMKTALSPVKVTGMHKDKHKVDDSKPRVYAVTHASAIDIPILYVYLPFQFRIVFKSELLAYPFVGWHLKRSGQVCINQQNPAASIGAIKSALRSLRGGMPLEMRVGEPVSTAGLTLRDTDEVSAKVKAAIEALHSAQRTM